MNIKLLISVGLGSLFITIIDLFQTASFEFEGITIAVLFIGYGFQNYALIVESYRLCSGENVAILCVRFDMDQAGAGQIRKPSR